MAGPLSLFRRYQKAMLAVFGVLLMITFVVTGNPTGCIDGQSRGDPIVFTTRQGSMHESELGNLMDARRRAHQFLVSAISVTVAAVRQDRTLASIPPEEIGRAVGEGFRVEGIDLRRDVTEESFVKSLIVARKAEELGIVISDQSISEFLRDRTLKRVAPEHFRRIHADLKFSQNQLFQALRLELLSARLQRMYFAINAIFGVPPGERWDYFERLNNRATAQAMALPVDSFLAQVGQPNEGQLQALYEEHKNDYSIPNQPEPGFHEPEKGKFQYFKADFEKLAEGIEVAEAEILDYYEKNKQAMFRYRGFSADPPTDEKPEVPTNEEKPAGDSDSTPSTEPTTEKPAEGDTPASEPASETTPVPEEKPAPTEPAPTRPEAATPPTAEQPSPPAPTNDPSAPQGAGGDDAAAGESAGQDPPAAAADDKQPQAAAAADEPALNPPTTNSDPAAGESKSSDAASSGATTATEGEPEAKAATEGQASTDVPAAPPAEPTIEPDGTLVLPESILAGPNPEFEPLWRVEETIRTALRRERAAAKVREAFQHLAEVVDEYGNRYTEYDLSKEESGGKAVGSPPAAPDFAKLATENGVTFHSTPLISLFDVAESELGKTFLNGNEPFVDAAFSELRLRIPRQSADVDNNQFLFWKIDKRDDLIPSFLEAREAVVRAWKFGEARKLALKKSQELAQEVDRSGKTLQELFGSAGTYKVVDTGEFSWLTTPSAISPEFGGGPPEVSQVAGIDRPGHDFMQAVFKLEPKQAGAAFNAPETIAYVVQLISSTPEPDELRVQFMSAPYRGYMTAGADDERRIELDWMKQLEKEADLVWVRPPSLRTR